MDAASNEYDARKKFLNAKGSGAKRITERDYADAQRRYTDSAEKNFETKERTGYRSAALPKEWGDKELESFRDEYDSSLGKKRGGSVAKPKLASDKKKYSDRDMQGIISQAKQMAPKIIQANQARAAQAQAAAGAQRPPLGGAMPARPPMGAMPTGAMPAMKKGGKLKLRRKG